ncbi:MAG: hypothetical protein QM737_20995 [Ferruginibacter sp.]
MKKSRFAIQVFLLVAAFPVLFIAGITHHENKIDRNDADVKKEEPVSIKKMAAPRKIVMVSSLPVSPGLAMVTIIKF